MISNKNGTGLFEIHLGANFGPLRFGKKNKKKKQRFNVNEHVTIFTNDWHKVTMMHSVFGFMDRNIEL